MRSSSRIIQTYRLTKSVRDLPTQAVHAWIVEYQAKYQPMEWMKTLHSLFVASDQLLKTSCLNICRMGWRNLHRPLERAHFTSGLVGTNLYWCSSSYGERQIILHWDTGDLSVHVEGQRTGTIMGNHEVRCWFLPIGQKKYQQTRHSSTGRSGLDICATFGELDAYHEPILALNL